MRGAAVAARGPPPPPAARAPPPPPAAVPLPPPAAAAAAAAAALRRRLLAHALLALSLALTGVIGSFYSPVWPVLMAVTLGASCAVQLVRLVAEAGAELQGAGWLFQGQGRYHAVRPEQQGEAAWEDGGEEAFELQQQVLAVGSLTAASPGRASALARILQAVHHGRDFSPEDFESLQELDTFWGAGSGGGSGGGGAAALTPPQIQALPSWRFSPSPSAAKGAAAAATAAAAAAGSGGAGAGGSADAGVARALDLAAAAQLQGPGCSICLEEFAAGELLRTLPCAHNYHAACVDQWLAQSGVCPECRCPCAEEEAGGGGSGAAGTQSDPWAPRGSGSLVAAGQAGYMV